MATNTTDSSRFLLNINSLNNVITSASGNATTLLSNTITSVQQLVNTSNYSLSANSLKSYSGSNISVGANLNLSNAGIYFNNNVGLLSNTLNGIPYMIFQTNSVERMRLTSNALGIGTKTPLATLDIAGDEIVRGSLYISSMGNVYADGTMYAQNFVQTSDPSLKTNVQPYVLAGLPTPVRFTWKATGLDDIGVLADEVKRFEPNCVSTRNGIQYVDYSKLVVLCLAELHSLRSTVESLVTRLPTNKVEPV